MSNRPLTHYFQQCLIVKRPIPMVSHHGKIPPSVFILESQVPDGHLEVSPFCIKPIVRDHGYCHLISKISYPPSPMLKSLQ